MWADEGTGTFTLGDEQVLSATVSNGQVHTAYGTGWEEYLKGEEWDDLVQRAGGKLAGGMRKRAEKGAPKGKGKGNGKA